jgi:hypothetical protein
MMVKAKNNTLKRRPIWRRQLGVFACLLALALALFGHIETSEAVSVDTKTAVVMLTHTDGPAEHGSAAAPQHCLNHTQCSFHALLPSSPSVNTLAAGRLGVSANHLGDSRAVSPHRHPPKTGALL